MADTDLGCSRRGRLASARLYLICDRMPGGRDLVPFLRAALGGGVDVVQLRDKRLAHRELVGAARAAGAVCRELGALFIVNDDPRAALAAEADGVHLGQSDMALAQARALVGEQLLIGLSTHSRAQVDAASVAVRESLVDYVGVGPVFETPTKPGREPVGLELVRYAAERAEVPFFAIGGIDARNARGVIDAGAERLAVVRAIAHSSQPRAAALALQASLGERSLEHA